MNLDYEHLLTFPTRIPIESMTKSLIMAKPSKRKPISERAQLTKKSILEAAAHIALKEGLDAVNTNRIAEKAGVSIGSLYQYYPDKKSILGELVESIILKRQARLREVLELKDLMLPMDTLVGKFIDAIFECQDREEEQLEALMIPLLAQSHQIDGIFKLIDQGEALVRPVLKSLITLKNPKMLTRDLDSVVFILMHSIRGVFVASSLSRTRINRTKLKVELKRLVLSYTLES
jgi:AcrR family transcriptional regulator